MKFKVNTREIYLSLATCFTQTKSPKWLLKRAVKFSYVRVLMMLLRELPDEVPTQLWIPAEPLLMLLFLITEKLWHHRGRLHTPGAELRVGTQRGH